RIERHSIRDRVRNWFIDQVNKQTKQHHQKYAGTNPELMITQPFHYRNSITKPIEMMAIYRAFRIRVRKSKTFSPAVCGVNRPTMKPISRIKTNFSPSSACTTDTSPQSVAFKSM